MLTKNVITVAGRKNNLVLMRTRCEYRLLDANYFHRFYSNVCAGVNESRKSITISFMDKCGSSCLEYVTIIILTQRKHALLWLIIVCDGVCCTLSGFCRLKVHNLIVYIVKSCYVVQTISILIYLLPKCVIVTHIFKMLFNNMYRN